MNTTIRIRVRRNGTQYLGECLDYPVMTHGRTLEELAENMEKALGLFLGDRGDDAESSVIVVKADIEEKT